MGFLHDNIKRLLELKDKEIGRLKLQIHDYRTVIEVSVMDLKAAQELGHCSQRLSNAKAALEQVLYNAGTRGNQKSGILCVPCGRIFEGDTCPICGINPKNEMVDSRECGCVRCQVIKLEKRKLELQKEEESDGSNNVAGGCDYA